MQERGNDEEIILSTHSREDWCGLIYPIKPSANIVDTLFLAFSQYTTLL